MLENIGKVFKGERVVTKRKNYTRVYKIVLSNGQKVQIFGDEDYADFERRLSNYGGKGLIYTKHGFVNPSFIVSIGRDNDAERGIYEDYTQYGLPFDEPKADFELPRNRDLNVLNLNAGK